MSSPTGIAPIEISADSVGLEGVRKLIEVGLLEAALVPLRARYACGRR